MCRNRRIRRGFFGCWFFSWGGVACFQNRGNSNECLHGHETRIWSICHLWICKFARFLFCGFFSYLLSTKYGAMYLSFLLQIAVTYRRLTLSLRLRELTEDRSDSDRKYTCPTCFFREHGLFHTAVSRFLFVFVVFFSFFLSATVKKINNHVWGGFVMKSKVLRNVSITVFVKHWIAVKWLYVSFLFWFFLLRFFLIFSHSDVHVHLFKCLAINVSRSQTACLVEYHF